MNNLPPFAAHTRITTTYSALRFTPYPPLPDRANAVIPLILLASLGFWLFVLASVLVCMGSL